MKIKTMVDLLTASAVERRAFELGSLSKDDGDEEVKKAIGLLRKTTTLHLHHAFFVHFFTVLARLRRENA